MKNTIFILEVFLLFAQVGYAQTPCEKTFVNARKLFVEKNYYEAKTQFQKVVNNCDSNKEIAKEYIGLCNGYISLAEQQQNQNRADKSTIDSLNRRISRLDDRIMYLEKDSIPFYANLLIKAKAENDSLKNVTNKQQQFWDSCESEKLALFDSFLGLGVELNGYLEAKLSKDNKQKIQPYDGVSSDSLIDVFRENLKLVNDIKTPILF